MEGWQSLAFGSLADVPPFRNVCPLDTCGAMSPTRLWLCLQHLSKVGWALGKRPGRLGHLWCGVPPRRPRGLGCRAWHSVWLCLVGWCL